MSILINKNTLIKLLKIISNGVLKTYTLKNEIFSNILLKIIKNKIFCISSNNEVEIITYDYIKTNIETEIILPFKTIYNICKTSKDNTIIKIKKNIKTIEITSENSLFTLPYNTNNIFPIFTKYKKTKNKILLESTILKNLFNKTYFSISENDSRQFLNGLFLEIKNDKLFSISSDGHRISTDYALLYKNNINNKVIIPKNTVHKFINTFPDNTQTTIYFSNSYIKFIAQNITLTSKVIEDTYPNIYNILNTKNYISVNINKHTLKSILLKKQILYNINNKKIKMTLNNNNMSITISNNIEHIITHLKIEYKNKPIEIGLNLVYIIETLNVIKSEKLELRFFDNNKIILKEKDNFNGTYLIMTYKI